MDRDQQRQNRRNTVSAFSCTSGVELTPLQGPTGRPAVDCDPTPAAPVPFTTVTPPVCPPPLPVPLNLPPGLIIVNDPTTAFCPSTAGYSVTGTTASSVTAGAQQQIVIFTAIADITDNQLNYLYEVVPGSSAAIISAALSGATNSVVALTHLNYTQSEELVITIQDAKFTVNTLAVEQARNLLICQVESNLQAASCTSSAYFGPSAAVPENLPYVPSATSTTGAVLVTFALLPSTGGQTAFTLLNIPSLTAAAAQANSLALAQAESSLRCVFGNAATAAACCTSEAPNNNLGFTYCVPAVGPTIEGSATAIGYFSVGANTVFSSVSLAEANSVARELSRNSLNCYFPSTGTTATCVSLGKTGPFASDSTTSTYLPPGSVILYDLEDSVTAANSQALLLAQASLNCFWSNSTTTAYCQPSPLFTAINNQNYILDASETLSISYSSSIPANTVISYVSQADANLQAFRLAQSSVSCVYCNDAVPPTCSGGLNATVGATADLICNVIPEVAQNTAISIGNSLVSTSNGGANCCYGNEGVTNSNKCTTGAFFDTNASSSFTSADVFYLPPNIITICASEPTPPNPTLLFSYTNLFASNNVTVGCCSDITTCSGTGYVTALPTLWAAQTNLFSGIAAGSTFYTSAAGSSAFAFPSTATYVFSRNTRAYRSITGGTGYTVGFTTCNPCTGGLPGYAFRGASGISYASDAAINNDIFCDGPTAQALTLYTAAVMPFGANTVYPVDWYSDACGLSAFAPVTNPGPDYHFFAGYKSGSTGYRIVFNEVGSNFTLAPTTYNLNSCPLARYPYSVYITSEACSTASGVTTLYGNLPAPQLFTSSTASTKFYTEFFNDASVYSYPSGTGYINYVHNTNIYYRGVSGSTAAPPVLCPPTVPLYPVTVQWSSTTSSPEAKDVCNFPNYYTSSATGAFNENIASLWCTVENPFVDSATAIFYTSTRSFPENVFLPGGSGTYYLSQFTPGDTFRSKFRKYSSSNNVSSLRNYTGSFAASPFSTANLWAHSATNNNMNVQTPNVPNTKFLVYAGFNCSPPLTYSDIKRPIPVDNVTYAPDYKTLPLVPVTQDIYSNSLLFDGVGYKLSSTAQGSSGANTITLNDLSKIGAGFTGAIVRCPDVTRIGNFQIPIEGTALPTYISSIDKVSGIITLGGYYNKVNTTFSNEPLYVTGFKIEAGSWTNTQFTCYGDHCGKLEIGHSLFSYYVGATSTTASIGYVTNITGNTVYYTGAPSANNFAAFDIGTGASHGSGHVYIQGRQFSRFWTDTDKVSELNYSLENYSSNFIWSQNFGQFTGQTVNYAVARNLMLGGNEFIIAGAAYSSATPPSRPYTTQGPLQWNSDVGYYTDLITWACDGSRTETLNLLYSETHGYIDSCCQIVARIILGVPNYISACDFKNTYGNAEISDFSGYVSYIPVRDTWYYAESLTPVTGDIVVEGQGGSTNVFAKIHLFNGNKTSLYPCNGNADLPPLPSANGVMMRLLLGYWDPDPENPQAPTDCDTPDGVCVTVNNPEYWTFSTNAGLSTGYIFREFVPFGDACNASNFTPISYAVTSGYRYSIWSDVTSGYADVNQPNPPPMNFDSSTTASCGSGAIGGFSVSSEVLEAAQYISNTGSENPAVIEFSPADVISPSARYAPSSFNFSTMPSVGSTANDLKAEATLIAQNIVNSFVRCFYLSGTALGKTCAGDQILVQRGYANAAEVVSNLSLADANTRAITIADSRTICLNSDEVGGPGCDQTKINSVSATARAYSGDNLFNINLSFPLGSTACNFNTQMSVVTTLNMASFTTKSIEVCSPTGGRQTLNVVTLSGDYSVPGYKLPIKYL
jgi:hypothetical protein